MKTTFQLTEGEADTLAAAFRAKRDEEHKAENFRASDAWHQAAMMIHDAQVASFQRRANKSRASRVSRSLKKTLAR